MKIALISEHASPLACLGGVDSGGQNVYVDKVARCLAARGHEVDVFTRRDDRALPAVACVTAGMRVVHVDAGPPRFVAKEAMLPFMAGFTAGMRRFMRDGPAYDVLHANFFMSGLVAMRLKAVLGLPMVMTYHALGLVRREHQGGADAFPAERVEIERRIATMADRLIAECPQDRIDLARLYGASPRRISMVPCGVDLDEFVPVDRRVARRALGIGDDEFVVLQLGRMVPRKGVDNVIRAVALMNGQPAPRLLVVGGDASGADVMHTPEVARLARLAADCGLADRVSFAGHRQRSQLALYYGACDVFVTTPWYEPFGITPLEAMAAARPVVGSAVGGIKHTVQDGETGFLVAPRDPEALAERLRRLQADPALATSMGVAGARRVARQFTWEHVASQLADIYADIGPARSRARREGVSWLPMGGRTAQAMPTWTASFARPVR